MKKQLIKGMQNSWLIGALIVIAIIGSFWAFEIQLPDYFRYIIGAPIVAVLVYYLIKAIK